MEAYGKEDKFGNENSNFDKPSTIHFSLLGFEPQMHNSSKLTNVMNMYTCNSIYKHFGN
jgi:hypothetical protein